MTEAQNLAPSCNPHPKAPHGFLRSASHSSDRYVCECESWDPYDAGRDEGFKLGYDASMEGADGADLLKRQSSENFLTLCLQCATGSMDDLQAANRAQTLLAGSGPLLMGEDPLLVFARECALGAYRREQLSLAAIMAMRQSLKWSWAAASSAPPLDYCAQKPGPTDASLTANSTPSTELAAPLPETQETLVTSTVTSDVTSGVADSGFLLARNCPSCRHSDSWGIADRSCLVRCNPTADGLGSNHEPLNPKLDPESRRVGNVAFQSRRPYASIETPPTPSKKAVGAAVVSQAVNADAGSDENLAVDGYLVVLAAQLNDHLNRQQGTEHSQKSERDDAAANSFLTAAPNLTCHCHRCIREKDLRDGMGWPLDLNRMVLCPECGNKRCPKASDHALACTASNASGQRGSIHQ